MSDTPKTKPALTSTGLRAYYRRRLRNGLVRVYFRSVRATARVDLSPAMAETIPRNRSLTLDQT